MYAHAIGGPSCRRRWRSPELLIKRVSYCELRAASCELQARLVGASVARAVIGAFLLPLPLPAVRGSLGGVDGVEGRVRRQARDDGAKLQELVVRAKPGVAGAVRDLLPLDGAARQQFHALRVGHPLSQRNHFIAIRPRYVFCSSRAASLAILARLRRALRRALYTMNNPTSRSVAHVSRSTHRRAARARPSMPRARAWIFVHR